MIDVLYAIVCVHPETFVSRLFLQNSHNSEHSFISNSRSYILSISIHKTFSVMRFLTSPFLTRTHKVIYFLNFTSFTIRHLADDFIQRKNKAIHHVSCMWQDLFCRWFCKRLLLLRWRWNKFASRSPNDLNVLTHCFSNGSSSAFDYVTSHTSKSSSCIFHPRQNAGPHFLWVMNHGICCHSDMWHLKDTGCGFQSGWETTEKTKVCDRVWCYIC